MYVCVRRSAVRDGRQAWMTGAPVPVGGPKPPAPTTAGPPWPVRAGPQFSASVAGGVLQRISAPSIVASGPSTSVFGNGQLQQQPPTLVASSVGPATVAGHTKLSTAGGGGNVPTKCPFSSAAMSSTAQYSTVPAADFNSQIKYATSALLLKPRN